MVTFDEDPQERLSLQQPQCTWVDEVYVAVASSRAHFSHTMAYRFSVRSQPTSTDKTLKIESIPARTGSRTSQDKRISKPGLRFLR